MAKKQQAQIDHNLPMAMLLHGVGFGFNANIPTHDTDPETII